MFPFSFINGFPSVRKRDNLSKVGFKELIYFGEKLKKKSLGTTAIFPLSNTLDNILSTLTIQLLKPSILYAAFTHVKQPKSHRNLWYENYAS